MMTTRTPAPTKALLTNLKCEIFSHLPYLLNLLPGNPSENFPAYGSCVVLSKRKKIGNLIFLTALVLLLKKVIPILQVIKNNKSTKSTCVVKR